MTEDVHVKIDSSKKHKYEKLNDDQLSIFYKKGQTSIFIAAACIGYCCQQRIPLPSGNKASDLFITSTLGSGNSEKLWILKSIAIEELGIDAIMDLKASMKVCQEFANYGIDYLYDIHSNPDINEVSEYSRKMRGILEDVLDPSDRCPVNPAKRPASPPFRRIGTAVSSVEVRPEPICGSRPLRLPAEWRGNRVERSSPDLILFYSRSGITQNMESWTANEAAQAWGISPRRVSILCREGRVLGAEMFGNSWAIPKDAPKPEDARTRSDFDTSGDAKPFVKWAGGKGQLIPVISSAYPEGFGRTIRRYAEPFVGGGAVLLDVLNRFDLDEVYISDINGELIATYRTISDRPDELIGILSRLQEEYIFRGPEERKEHYLEHRRRFNDIMSSGDEVERSALFIYLNKTCFNGLYRVNSKGEFNVPSGVYKNPKICDPENIMLVSDRLQIVDINLADFRASSDFIDENTFVYFDPPYRPLTVTSAFTSYTELSFDDDDQRALAEYFKELTERGARVAVSNSDPHNVDPNDNFFEEIYQGATITRVPANRMINSKASGRGKINELLITNYEPVGAQRTLSSYCEGDRQDPSAF